VKGDIDFFKVFGAVFTTEWRNEAKCLDLDDDTLFFDLDREEEAELYCSDCPVKLQCLDDALYYNDAAHRCLTENERKSILMHRKRHVKAFCYDLGLLDVET
jgi:glutaminase